MKLKKLSKLDRKIVEILTLHSKQRPLRHGGAKSLHGNLDIKEFSLEGVEASIENLINLGFIHYDDGAITIPREKFIELSSELRWKYLQKDILKFSLKIWQFSHKHIITIITSIITAYITAKYVK